MTEYELEARRADYLTELFNKRFKPCREFHWFIKKYNDPNGQIFHPDQTYNDKFWAAIFDEDENELVYEEWKDRKFFDTELEALKHMNDKMDKAFKGD
jgi:hypothetical protein